MSSSDPAPASLSYDRLMSGPTWWPPGHYYSPHPDLAAVKMREKELFDTLPTDIAGIDLRKERQFQFLRTFARLERQTYADDPPAASARYTEDNQTFNGTDAAVLRCMLRMLRPRQYIEIGSGYTSAVALDTNDFFLNGSMRCTFIEPFPDTLHALLRPHDLSHARLIASKLQDVDFALFSTLDAGDVLFVDSTHVVKTGSDVQHLFFEVIPRLKPGVFVHFHDIFYPFEYPKEWVYQGWAWNELYFLRAVLQYGSHFDIEFFTSYLLKMHEGLLRSSLPSLRDTSAGSIWLSVRGSAAPSFSS